MRILHTSDWHLGAAHCERSRAEEQGHFLDWLLTIIEARQVDVLVVAGDVFDTANPPAEALSLYYRFLARLSALGGTTASGGSRAAVIVGGNHDSASRLDAPRDALEALEAYVIGGYDAAREGAAHADPAGVLVPLRAAGGDVQVVLAAVPFLNDWRIGVRGFDASPDEQLTSMHEKFTEVYARLADKASAAFPGVPVVATGHLTCLAQRGTRVTDADGIPCEINRVGTLGAMGPSIFDERYRYVALGHIHRGFAVDGRARYSGTPLQVGLVEGADDRKVLLVDLAEGGTKVEPIGVPVRRRLLKLAGSLEEVRAKLQALQSMPGELPPYVSIEATLAAPDAGAEAALRDFAESQRGASCDVVSVRTSVVRQGGAVDASSAAAFVAALTPESAFEFAWQARYGRDSVPSDPVMQRFRKLVEENARRGEKAS
jgi:exonuclease SbcD